MSSIVCETEKFSYSRCLFSVCVCVQGVSCTVLIFVNWFICLCVCVCVEAQQCLSRGGVLSVCVTVCCGIS